MERLQETLEKVRKERITEGDRELLWLIYKLGGKDVYLRDLKYFFTQTHLYIAVKRLMKKGFLVSVREPLNRRVSLTGKGRLMAELFDREVREIYV